MRGEWFRATARSLAHSPIETPYAALNSILAALRLFAVARPNGFCYDDPLRQEVSVKRGQHRLPLGPYPVGERSPELFVRDQRHSSAGHGRDTPGGRNEVALLTNLPSG